MSHLTGSYLMVLETAGATADMLTLKTILKLKQLLESDFLISIYVAFLQ